MAGPAPDGRHRSPTNLTKLNGPPAMSRSVLVNHFSKKVDQLAATTNFPKLQAFAPQNLIPWLGSYLKYALTPRFQFPDYSGSGKTGLYPLVPRSGGEIRISIAGDWATGTEEAERVAAQMQGGDADLTIHLGDVYYVGDEPEIAENCLGKSNGTYSGVTWPHGANGSFALNGNHEMYANGKPYFTTFLRSLGMPAGGAGQVASFFCLEADAWRIIGVDTGYNSVGIPILSLIPGINQIPVVGGDCHLEDKLIAWLRNTVKPRENPKATLLLSHHQYYSAFPDKAYTRAAKQLKEFFGDQEVLWMWGHEHRLGIYGKFSTAGGITAYGRCVGHSGMPVEAGTPDIKKAPLQLYDPRTHPLEDGTLVGENGFVNLTIAGAVLTLDYRDLDGTQVLLESFTANGVGDFTRALLKDPGILKAPGL